MHPSGTQHAASTTPSGVRERVARVGVLITNLGTPDAPTPPAVRRFLGEMLSDPRLVKLPRILWLPILHGIVLRVRPARSAHAYGRIWSTAGSPQLVFGQRLAAALRETLPALVPGFAGIELGMRYGNPSIASAAARLRESGAERLMVVPLFPQYSGATTASTLDALSRALEGDAAPEANVVADYHDESEYIAALAASVRQHWQGHGRAEHLVMSFHGMPKDSIRQGDPYFDRCQVTGKLLAQALALPDDAWTLSFQSRFGMQEWLRPYTLDVLTGLVQRGIRHVQVICPGFSLDCLETLEEIALSAAETFRAQGGEKLEYIAALNDRPDHVTFLARLIAQYCEGWHQAQNLDADVATTTAHPRIVAFSRQRR